MSSSQALASAHEVELLRERLANEPVLGLDTEGDGMFRYRTRLCTIQLASAQELAVIDTLVVEPARLLELLGEQGPEKVVHDAAFDARMLAAAGAPLGNVFDTAIAARFLGFASTGLASLLDALFEISLPKHMQMADWGERPLSEEAILYLENDVRHLLALRDELLSRVRTVDIEHEVREECAYVLQEARKPEPERSPFSRVKGATQLKPKERARLYELAEARDVIGRELDEPVGRVIANELLFRLAQLERPPLEDVEKRLSMRVRPYAQVLQEAYERSLSREDAPAAELEPVDAPSPGELARRKKRRALVMDFRAREAKKREVDPQVVLPGHCVNDMVRLSQLSEESLAGIAGLGGFRVARYLESWRSEWTAQW